MIEAVGATLSNVCEPVLVVGGTVGGLGSVADRRPGAGPLGGLEALLLSGLDDQYLVCPSDIPLVTVDLLRRLTGPSDSAATIFDIEGESRVQSLPLRISSAALEAITTALDAGRNSIHGVLDLIDVDRIPITAQEGRSLLNVNTPADYDALVALLEQG